MTGELGDKRGLDRREDGLAAAWTRQHGHDAIAELARLAKHGRSEMTRVAEIRELLDRGYGKASQPVEGELHLGVSLELQRLLDAHDGQSRSIPLRTTETALVDLNSDGGDHGARPATPRTPIADARATAASFAVVNAECRQHQNVRHSHAADVKPDPVGHRSRSL